MSRTRIAVQLHGAADSWDPFPEFLGGLRFAGAQVVPIRVYRWKPAPLGGVFDHLVTGIARRQFDAVTFTSAPAAAAVLERSRELDIEDQLLAALRTDVHAMCVGPVTSRPLIRKGVPTSAPERMRLGALARHIAEELPLLGSCTFKAAGHVIEIRGTSVLVDDSVKPLSPSEWRFCARWYIAPAASSLVATCYASYPATAATPTPWTPPYCGYERLWATRTSWQQW